MHFIDQLITDDPALVGSDIFALRDRLLALFSRYGQVCRLDLVRADQGQARRVMCFLRMSSEQEEQALVNALGMGRFGGDLVMVLALDPAGAVPAPWLITTPQPSPASLR